MWPENWDTVQLFLRCTSQLNRNVVVGFGMAKEIVTGFRFEGVEAKIRLLRIEPERWAELVEGLELMESVVVGEMNKR